MIWVEFCVIFVIHILKFFLFVTILYTVLVHFFIFLKQIQYRKLCVFSLQKKSISKSDKKPVFEPPEIFSTKTYFPEPQGDKETEKEQTSEKNSWKMIFCLHEYISCTKEAINAFQLNLIYSKIWTLIGS